jgi:hypothetical protein
MVYADLHVRTVKSLGRVTPINAVLMAEEKKLKAIAIVDHDTVEGVPEAVNAGEFYGKEVVPAVELMYEIGSREAHIIGYFIDWHSHALLNEIDRLQTAKVKQIEKMVKRINDLGVEMSYEDVLAEASQATFVSRSNIAQVLVKKKAVKDFTQAFDKYLGVGKPAYVPKDNIPISQIMQPIMEAGGVPALSHPKFNGAEELIPELVKNGLKALEVYHPTFTKEETVRYQQLAKKYRLVEVGGTDSEPKRPPVGTITVPYENVEKLKKLTRAS